MRAAAPTAFMRSIFSEMLADTEGEVLDAPFDTMKERTVAREIVTEKLPAARAMVAAYDEIGVRHRRQPQCQLRRKVMKQPLALIVAARYDLILGNGGRVIHACRSRHGCAHIIVPGKILPARIEGEPHFLLMERPKPLPSPGLEFVEMYGPTSAIVRENDPLMK